MGDLAERLLLLAIYHKDDGVFVREIAHQAGNFKQNCYFLQKWEGKGWYEYGVSLDLGWLTEAGKQEALKALPAPEVSHG
jgi:hypothetical protein